MYIFLFLKSANWKYDFDFSEVTFKLEMTWQAPISQSKGGSKQILSDLTSLLFYAIILICKDSRKLSYLIEMQNSTCIFSTMVSEEKYSYCTSVVEPLDVKIWTMQHITGKKSQNTHLKFKKIQEVGFPLHLKNNKPYLFEGENPLLQSEMALEGSVNSVPEEMQSMAAHLLKNAPKDISSYAFKMDVFTQVRFWSLTLIRRRMIRQIFLCRLLRNSNKLTKKFK